MLSFALIFRVVVVCQEHFDLVFVGCFCLPVAASVVQRGRLRHESERTKCDISCACCRFCSSLLAATGFSFVSLVIVIVIVVVVVEDWKEE